MIRVTDTELMTIGVFARTTGLTPGALRFYADSGVLTPAEVDEFSGYRYYAAAQIDHAVTIRQLRDIGMPLDAVADVLSGNPAAIDRHVARLGDDARRAGRTAAALHRTFAIENEERFMITVNGPVFANAVEQVITATTHDPEAPVLSGVFLEIDSATMTLTATDRYRLSTRTMPVQSSRQWTGVLDGVDLRAALPFVRRTHRVHIEMRSSAVDFMADGGDAQPCRVLAEQFPDYRAMLDGLPDATARVVVSRTALLRGLEEQPNEYVKVVVAENNIELGDLELPAAVTGSQCVLAFGVTTLYPAVASGLGPDVMLDIIGEAMPVLVRSADDGDLLTSAMPVEPSLVGG